MKKGRLTGLPSAAPQFLWLPEESAAHRLEVPDALLNILRAHLKIPGQTINTKKLRRASVNELAGDGHLILGEGPAALPARTHGACTRRASSTRLQWASSQKLQ